MSVISELADCSSKVPKKVWMVKLTYPKKVAGGKTRKTTLLRTYDTWPEARDRAKAWRKMEYGGKPLIAIEIFETEADWTPVPDA